MKIKKYSLQRARMCVCMYAYDFCFMFSYPSPDRHPVRQTCSRIQKQKIPNIDTNTENGTNTERNQVNYQKFRVGKKQKYTTTETTEIQPIICAISSAAIQIWSGVVYESKKEPEIERNHKRFEFRNLTIDNAQLGQRCVLPQSVKEVAELGTLQSDYMR